MIEAVALPTGHAQNTSVHHLGKAKYLRLVTVLPDTGKASTHHYLHIRLHGSGARAGHRDSGRDDRPAHLQHKMYNCKLYSHLHYCKLFTFTFTAGA